MEDGWKLFCSMDWKGKDRIIHEMLILPTSSSVRQSFLDQYRQHMVAYFREDFYDIVESQIPFYAKQYSETGELNVPLLKESCLGHIAEWSMTVEEKGNSRYNTTRPVYPPGEVSRYADTDPRKHLHGDANLVAVARRHMVGNEVVEWIYHSPHLQLLVQGVMQFENMHTYKSDLGLAVNIMRPTPIPDVIPQTALSFHFDTIDSSIQKDSHGNHNARGATGVIGIQDCVKDKGGERVCFPTINRESVDNVAAVLEKYQPLTPTVPINGCTPVVVQEPIAGMLSLFNGGDVLHGVSSVREGVRVAVVFLYCETEPTACGSTDDSADSFYGKN